MFQLIKEYGLKKIICAGASEVRRKVKKELMENSFSQDGEDIIIDKLLGYKKNGFYLEIGAYHPTRLSNTYRFYKRGWSGVTVEPNPEVIKKFKTIRPRDTIVPMGVGAKKGEMNYYHYLIPALNTFSEKQVEENKKNGYKVSKISKIKIIDIQELLKKHIGKNKIDFLSLDVEGWDEEILNSWDWQYKPKVICVEGEKMKIKGYVLAAKTQYNLIFTLKD